MADAPELRDNFTEETYWDYLAQHRMSVVSMLGGTDSDTDACPVHDLAAGGNGATWDDGEEGKVALFQGEEEEGKISLLPLWLWAFMPWARADGMPRCVCVCVFVCKCVRVRLRASRTGTATVYVVTRGLLCARSFVGAHV